MAINLNTTRIYHITDIANLPSIVADGGLWSDVALARRPNQAHQVIGYAHIKHRRMHEYRVDCVNNRFVGEFVPFYYCPRSPMLFVINKGSTGRPPGCQNSIVHLYCNVGPAIALQRPWAVADGNAGAASALFSSSIAAFESLEWPLINSDSWGGRTHHKQAEFLIADHFPWQSITGIGCMDQAAANRVNSLLANVPHKPQVSIQRGWYF